MVTTSPFFDLTARDLMSRDVVTIPEADSLREAARLLSQARISGAPVVDHQGKRVGVLSATDFLRWAEKQGGTPLASSHSLPRTCSFWVRQRDALGKEDILCMLPPGACSIQSAQMTPEGKEVQVCREPFSVPTDWQVVLTEELPPDAVRLHMTADIVTVAPDTPVRELARMMLDAHVHRLIVVDEERRPVGIISSTDILAAVARGDGVAAPDPSAK